MWYYYRCVIRPMIAKNATKAHVSSAYASILSYCFLLITVVSARCIPCHLLLCVSWSSSRAWAGTTAGPVPVLCAVCWGLIFGMSPSSPSCFLRRCMVSLCDGFLVFYYFICCGSGSALLSVHDWYAWWRRDLFHSRIHRSHSCHVSDTVWV